MHAILAQGATGPTHEHIAAIAGVTQRSVGNVITQTSAERLVVGGRPAALGPGLGLVVGVAVGSEGMRGAIFDANGAAHHPRQAERAPQQLAVSPDVLLGRLRSLVSEILEAAVEDAGLRVGPRRDALPLLGVAVAWPTPLDRSKRPRGRALRDGAWRMRVAGGAVPTLPERMAEVLGPPFTVGRCHAINDGSAHALARAFDVSRARASAPDDDQWKVASVVVVGGGLGAGTILLAPHRQRRLSFIDARLIEGTNGLAGELGHLPIGRRVVEELSAEGVEHDLAPLGYDEWRCSCGRPHHLEAFVSGRAIERRLASSGYRIPTDGPGRDGLVATGLAGDLDDAQIHAIKDMGRLLGRALAGTILMLDPQSITITGSLAGKHLVDGINLERGLWGNAITDAVEIDYVYDPLAGARGAALAVLRQQVYRHVLDGRALAAPTVRLTGEQLKPLQSGKRAVAEAFS